MFFFPVFFPFFRAHPLRDESEGARRVGLYLEESCSRLAVRSPLRSEKPDVATTWLEEKLLRFRIHRVGLIGSVLGDSASSSLHRLVFSMPDAFPSRLLAPRRLRPIAETAKTNSFPLESAQGGLPPPPALCFRSVSPIMGQPEWPRIRSL